ncbi:hypothetical protein DKX38_001763 [Salix brachista]|uniref:Endonuclease/exonuclease/phosphatase domain-containing protein n=1 Tax=Salix brachista TaxID=2182728 RepID=A0A5N5NK81_9ROSI|nr:hypothetical protein DKX38_001763 [Salix brachista]
MMDSLGSHSSTSEDPKDNHEASSSSGTQPTAHESPPDNWNTWGLNSPNKIWSVQNWIKSHHLDIIGLIETKVSISNLPRVESHLNLIGWDFFSNATLDSPCRILVGWNTLAYTLTNFHSSPQWITCDALSLKTQISAKLTFVYGHNNASDRKPLWDYIVRTSPLYCNCPWILMGDFNAVLQAHNRSGGDSRWLGHHNDFHNATHQAQLFTLPFTGMNFTWTNGQRQRLSDVLSPRQIASLGFHWHDNLNVIISHGSWNFPDSPPHIQRIWDSINFQPHSLREDTLSWLGSPSGGIRLRWGLDQPNIPPLPDPVQPRRCGFHGPPFSSGPLSAFLPGARLVSPGPPCRLPGLLLGLLAFRLGFCLGSLAVRLGSFMGLLAVSLGPPRSALGLAVSLDSPGIARGLGSPFEPVFLLRPAGLALLVQGPGSPPLLPRASP